MCHPSWRDPRHRAFHHGPPSPPPPPPAPPPHEEMREHLQRARHRHNRGEGGPQHPLMHHRRPFDREVDRLEAASNFGIRRPLRFLTHKLGLDEKQVAALARILDDLKIERAQAEVDDRRALTEFADAISGDSFDRSKAESAGERRVRSATNVRDMLIRSLEQIHEMLSPEQREQMAYLIRSGVLSV